LIKAINILINQVEDLREEIGVKNADLDRMEGEIRNLKARLTEGASQAMGLTAYLQAQGLVLELYSPVSGRIKW
jgi:hypothetical protein